MLRFQMDLKLKEPDILRKIEKKISNIFIETMSDILSI